MVLGMAAVHAGLISACSPALVIIVPPDLLVSNCAEVAFTRWIGAMDTDYGLFMLALGLTI